MLTEKKKTPRSAIHRAINDIDESLKGIKVGEMEIESLKEKIVKINERIDEITHTLNLLEKQYPLRKEKQ
jgi:hypothetical protein